MCGSDIFLGILAVFFPPLAVWVKRGICSADSLINIALSVLGFLPGLLHAWYIIASYPDPTHEQVQQQDSESGRVTHYYIQQEQPPRRGAGGMQPHGGQTGYGTLGSAPAQQFPGQGGAPFPAAGSSTETPPTYQEAVRGDNKVQSSK